MVKTSENPAFDPPELVLILSRTVRHAASEAVISHSCQGGTTPLFSVPIRGTDVAWCTVASGS